MKILAVLFLVLFGYIFLSSKIHAEGRGLKEDATRFTRKSNNEEEQPLARNDPKDGIGRSVTVEKVKETSYEDRSARNDINSNVSNNEKYIKEGFDESNGDAYDDSNSSTSSHHNPSVENYCSKVPGIHCRKN